MVILLTTTMMAIITITTITIIKFIKHSPTGKKARNTKSTFYFLPCNSFMVTGNPFFDQDGADELEHRTMDSRLAPEPSLVHLGHALLCCLLISSILSFEKRFHFSIWQQMFHLKKKKQKNHETHR